MFALKITAAGDTMNDIETAIDEAVRKIKQGYTGGFDSNDTGSYSIELTGEETLDPLSDED